MVQTEKAVEEYLLEGQTGNANKEPIDPDADLFKKGLVDSMGMLRLVAFVEEEFGISVPEEELRPENFRTIRSVCKLVHSMKGNG